MYCVGALNYFNYHLLLFCICLVLIKQHLSTHLNCMQGIFVSVTLNTTPHAFCLNHMKTSSIAILAVILLSPLNGSNNSNLSVFQIVCHSHSRSVINLVSLDFTAKHT